MIILFTLIFLQFGLGNCLDFHRNTTGVAFSAYVHNNVPTDSIADWTKYSLNDVKTMMKVMSTRFSKISTFGVGAGADVNPYRPKQTYNRSYSQIYSAEAAAHVNKEMSQNDAKYQPIQMYIGIWLHSHSTQLNMEANLAIESAQIANKIYPNTVKGFILGQEQIGTNLNVTQMALHEVQLLKNVSKDLGLKLGTRQICSGLEAQATEYPNEITAHRMGIISETDFIICEVDPQTSFETASAFAGVTTKLLKYKTDLKAINPRIEVMGQTGWPGRLAHQWEVNNMKEYWELVDKWSYQNNFTMWMLEAIDNPWKRWDDKAGSFGWWKLKEDSKTSLIDGYIEKVEQVPITTDQPSSATTDASKHDGRSDQSGKKKNGASGSHFCGSIAILSSFIGITFKNIFM